MAREKTTNSSGTTPPPNLTSSRTEVEKAIASRIDEGTQLLNLPIPTEEDLDKAQKEYLTWDEYNTLLLKTLFNSPEVSEKYNESIRIMTWSGLSFEERIEEHRDDVKAKIRRLESIRGQLPLFKELPLSPMKDEKQTTAVGNEVFIVHGHDEASKEAVARFLEKLELRPIILHEQPDKGRTIIEKFEDHSFVAYAVVLLTPDDVGAPASEGHELSPRARQNVIFELGYFMGKLGRKKVCALHKEDLKLPTDILGVLYIPLDKAGAWKLLLARELKAAGLNINLNKAVET